MVFYILIISEIGFEYKMIKINLSLKFYFNIFYLVGIY